MKPTDPALWRRVTTKYRATSEGSPPGRWSPRKASLSRLEYEREGGKWKNITPPQTRGA